VKQTTINTEVTANHEQKLYIIPCSGGFSCLGFEVCQRRYNALAAELGEPVKAYPLGSMDLYNEYQRVIAIAGEKHRQTGWRAKSELIPEFIGREGERVEVQDKHGNKRRFYIGKSTGVIPIHLEISKSNSTGGPAVYGHPFQQITFLGKRR
jgi:hypothetical protein